MSCWCLGDFRSQALLHVAVPMEPDSPEPPGNPPTYYRSIACIKTRQGWKNTTQQRNQA